MSKAKKGRIITPEHRLKLSKALKRYNYFNPRGVEIRKCVEMEMSKIVKKTRDVIRQKADGWYFVNETWSDEYGPYRTERVAQRKLRRYGRLLNKRRRKDK